ncbi:MAG: hypothetical protein RXS42_07885 [Nitrososphaeria archaeon]
MSSVGAEGRAARSARGRPADFPGRICPRCGERYTSLDIHRDKGREYLYAIHIVRRNGVRTRRKCYLGPLEGYRYGAIANVDAAWFGAPIVTLEPQARFTAYLGYLKNIAHITVNSARTAEELGNVIDALAEVQRAASLRLRAAAAPPADRPAGADPGGVK